MPLLRFDIIHGRSPEEVRAVLDTAHEAMLESFGVPPGDRYQVVHQHPPHELHVEDTPRLSQVPQRHPSPGDFADAHA